MANRLGAQLFISRLSAYTTIERLESLFSPFGSVSEARLIRDPKTQRPKGFGFVTFQSPAEAKKALQAMNGRRVVTWWKGHHELGITDVIRLKELSDG